MPPSPRNCPTMESQKCHSLTLQVLFLNPLNIDVDVLFVCRCVFFVFSKFILFAVIKNNYLFISIPLNLIC